MFFCCCPKQQQDTLENKKSLNSSLIENEMPKSQINEQIKDRVRSNDTHDSQPRQRQSRSSNKKQRDIYKPQMSTNNQNTQYKQEQVMSKAQPKQKLQNNGVVPNFGKSQSLRPFSPRQHQKNLSSSKKSHLWKQQIKSDFIYINSNCSSYIYMSYRLAKNQQTKQYQDGLDYFLSKAQDKIHLIVGKQQVFHNKTTTLNKFNFNTIVAVISNQNRYCDLNLGNTEAIFLQDLRGIRWNGINSIIVLADSLHNSAQVKDYFDIIFKDLKWEDIKKTSFLFPPFMTIEDISILLFSYFKQYITNLNLERVSLDLSYDMQLIEGTNLDSCIIIKSRSQQAKLSNAVYDHLKLSIVFFAKELSESTQRIFIDFYIQLKQKSLKEYFEMKEFYRKNPLQFQSRMKKIKDMDFKLFSDLQNSVSLKQTSCEQLGSYYEISSKVRQDIGKIYNIPELQKKEVDTPIKKEWDDDATADDFKTTKKMSLDLVAKEELDKIDLDMGLGDDSDQEKIYDQNDDNIVLNVQETRKMGLGHKYN